MIQGQQNWSYHHTENAWPIVHTFLPKDKELNNTAVLKQKLEVIQNVECNNHLRGGIINLHVLTDISWMISMFNMGYRYAVIWFEGNWPANEDFNLALLEEIDRYNAEDDNWMLAGQLQVDDETVYPYVARSFVIVNLRVWMQHKTPPFWEPKHAPASINFNLDRNWEDSAYNLHGDPEWNIRDKTKFKFMFQHNMCTTWLQYSFLRNLTVWGISDKLMKYVTLTKPYMGSHELELGISGQQYDSSAVSVQGRKFIENIFSPTSPIYFVNTEPSRPNYAQQLVGSVFEQYVGATAGFKLLYYAYKYGVNQNTNFVWYDFDTDSCQFKRDTLKHWDGKDYPAWVRLWCHAHPNANDNLMDLAIERWPRVIDQFGGMHDWLEFWNKIRQCEHQILKIDLINNNSELMAQLESKRTFMWTSNIYSYIIPKLLAQPFQLERSFMNLIDGLNAVHPDCWFAGTDVNDADLMCPARVILSATDNASIGLEE